MLVLVNNRRRSVFSQRGFGVGAALYLILLAGVAGGVYFSSLSQTLSSAQSTEKDISLRQMLASAANTLAAGSSLSSDSAVLCPPRGDDASTNCATAPVFLAPFSAAEAKRLPIGYEAVATSGSPKEVGILTTGSLPQLDPFGRYYIICRWENPRSTPSSPAFSIISAGADGALKATCATTENAHSLGTNKVKLFTVGSTIDHADKWFARSASSISYGVLGSGVDVDNAGNITSAGSVLASSASFGSLLAGSSTLGAVSVSSLTDSGSASIFGGLTAGSVTSNGAGLFGSISAGSSTLGAVSVSSLTDSGSASINGTLTGVDGIFSNSLTAPNLKSTGSISGSSITVNNTNGGAGVFSSLGVTGDETIAGNLTVSGVVTAGRFIGDGSGLTNIQISSVSGLSDILSAAGSSVLGVSTSAANPYSSFSKTTGLFSDTASSVATSILGTEKMRVSSSGVGLSVPLYISDTSGSATIFLNRTAGTPGGKITSLSDCYGMDFYSYSGGSYVQSFRIMQDSGYVGIKTTSSSSPLSVAGGASIGSGYTTTAAPSNGLIIQGNVGIGTSSPAATLHVVSPNATVANFQSTGSADNIIKLGSQTITVNAGDMLIGSENAIHISANNDVQFPVADTVSVFKKLKIDSGGNTDLDILILDGSADHRMRMDRKASGSGGAMTVQSGGGASGSTDKNGGTLNLSGGISTGTGSSSINFQTASAGLSGTTDNTPTTKMTILGSGSVGIGTTAPTVPLEVAGEIKSTTTTLSATATSTSCTTAGKIIYSADTHFYGCNGSEWKQLDN